MSNFDKQLRKRLCEQAIAIERELDGDVIFFYGPIYPGVQVHFREFIEKLHLDADSRNRLIVFLNTPGGSAETVEKLVEMIRFHYDEVFFVVPDEAMSAGTIFCMSGDRIYMDYTSSLGPIDPQVHNGKEWVPALGYLDQVEKMIERSAQGQLTDAEVLILRNQDLAMLSRCEQAKNLTITLMKRWLVDYKFKKWTVHSETSIRNGQAVTIEEKTHRAEQIATMLSDNKKWHSHGRMIGISTLRTELRLQIEDYSGSTMLRALITSYNDSITDYIKRHEYRFFLHSRLFT